MLFINPAGITVEIDDPQMLKDVLRNPKFKAATEEETERYNLERGIADETAQKVLFRTSEGEPDGYGQSGLTLKRELAKQGIHLTKQEAGQKVGLVYNYPDAINYLNTPVKIIYTMFESTTIPQGWVDDLRKANLVLTPSRFCRDAFKTRGIDAKVVQLGYDDTVFNYKEKDKNNPVFTFLHYDAFKIRKGWDILFKAFNEEFKPDEPVRMVFKTTKSKEELPFPILKSQYPNIDVIHDNYTPQELEALLHSADCFVFPSRGEGFGLTPLEALATGTPTIIPNGSGMAEYFHADYFIELKVKGTTPAMYQTFRNEDVGEFIEPDLEDLKRKMRWVYQNKQQAYKQAEKGAKWVKQNYSISETAAKLAPYLETPEETMELETDEDAIVFLTEDTQHITGGRYYSWWLATALKAAGHKVIIYTNRTPIFIDEFKDYPQPEIRVVRKIDRVDVKAKMYVGSPIVGSETACKLGNKYQRPVYVEVFDPFPMMEKYRGQHNWQGWDTLIEEMKNPRVNIISLCRTTTPWIKGWLNKTNEQVKEVYPCINSIERDKTPKPKAKKNWVTFVSRLDHHKKLDHVLDAIKETDCELQVITSIDGIGFEKMVAERGMQNQVKIHKLINDRDKFEIIKKSRAVINGAIFEGFGMWLTEALAAGVPCVCYDYPTFNEIVSKLPKKENLTYFAEYNNPEDLKAKLKQALEEGKTGPGTSNFDFEAMVSRVKEVFSPKVGVVMIALNEEEYIGPAIEAAAKMSEISRIAVVEGCVALNATQANEWGLSTDNTKKAVLGAILGEFGHKIAYIQHGWALDKSELRNRGLKELLDCEYIMVIDADEVWKREDFKKLYKHITEHPETSVVWYPAYHFWKQPDLVAVGGQWDAHLFRFFKFSDKTIKWYAHHTPPENERRIPVTKLGEEATLNNVHFYHYGAMKPEDKIKAKLDFYARRDTNLQIKNTWSNWKPGQDTQWTHGGGKAKKFKGTHPEEILKIWKKQS